MSAPITGTSPGAHAALRRHQQRDEGQPQGRESHQQPPDLQRTSSAEQRRILDVQVDVGAVAGGVGDVAEGRGHHLEHVLQLLVLTVEGVQGEVEVAQRRAEVGVGLVDDRLERLRERRRLAEEPGDRGASRRDLSGDEVGGLHQPDQVVGAVRQLVGHAAGRLEQLAVLLGALADQLGQLADPLQGRPDVVGGRVEGPADLAERLRQDHRVELTDLRGALLDDVLQVVGHRGARQRDQPVGELTAPRRLDLEVVGAEEGGDLDLGARVGAELDVVVDLEGDHDLLTVQVDGLHHADRHAMDLDALAGPEPGAVLELGGVGRGAEGDDGEHDDQPPDQAPHHDGHDADPEGITRCEGLHRQTSDQGPLSPAGLIC